MTAAPSSQKMVLECVAGPDILRKIVIGDKPVTIGSEVYNPDLAIESLTGNDGCIIATVKDGMLELNGESCTEVMYLNNDEGDSRVFMREKDVLRLVNSIWRAGVVSDPRPGGLNDRFSDLIGLEELHDFRLSHIFSEVFKKHTSEEMEEQLITGTTKHTPALSELKVEWAKPWLFARLLGGSALLTFILYEGFMIFNNANLIPGMIFVGSFAVPVSTLIFFLEMNVPRNISIFKITQLLFVGGIASLILALVFFSNFDLFTSFLGASAAGIIEETAKVLIVAWLVGKQVRYKWTLNGLLLGAAVGTGFAAFESAGYAFRYILGDGVTAGGQIILLRGMLAPFMHIVWTANAAAALWMVKGDRPFSWEMLQAPAFLRVFLAMVILHMIWNAPFGVLSLPVVQDLKFVLLGILGWMICFRLVQQGLRQLNRARQSLELPAITGQEDPTVQ
jgi:RsiW-degrading membrane proteinase PrsW (M82 family)